MADDQPITRPMHFESGSIGDLARHVDMFRGDLAISLSLLSMPGKPGDSLLDTDVVLTYRSNVNQQVTRWNIDAPTSVLGQGWSLDGSAIMLTSTGSLAPGARRYAIVTNGVSNPLIPIAPELQAPVRATLDLAARATLSAGAVSSAVLAAFAAQGLMLDRTAVVSGSGPWLIADAANERDFLVTSTAGGATVTDGGVSYQLHNYEFWFIVYYASYERWEVTTEAGEVRSYGGGVSKTAKNFRQGVGNSIEWGVAWSKSGAAAWANASAQVTGQVQYARAWHLAARRDCWGNVVTYAYNEFGRDPASGVLLRGAEQLVAGAGGLPYTKAVYLTTITTVFGYRIAFEYADKSCTAQLQEYMDPHKQLTFAFVPETPPANVTAPNAYQDQYETLYLTALTLSSPAGALLSRFTFAYGEPCVIPGMTGTLAATAAKRYLTGITKANAVGQTLPPYLFTYCLEAGSGPNYGAIASMRYAQGATATWTYTPAEVTACNRTLTVDAPATLGADCAPWVWFGPDYAVMVWVDAAGKNTELTVYSWVGNWVGWAGGRCYGSSLPLTTSATPITAQLNANCFCLLFTDSQGNVWPALFGRSSATPTLWSACAPQPSVASSAAVTSLAGGDDFIVATLMGEQFYLYRWSWNWAASEFTGTAEPQLTSPNALYAVAASEAYLLATVTSGASSIALCWLDPVSNTWIESAGTVQLGYDVSANSDKAMHWAMGPTCAAIAFTNDTLRPDYVVALLNWDGAYTLQSTLLQQVQDPNLGLQSFTAEAYDQATGAPFPPVPAMGSNGFVGVRQYVFRYDGIAWSAASFGTTTSALPEGWLATTYGTDVAVQTVNDGIESCTATLIAYDPNGGGFAATPTTIAASIPGPVSGIANQGWPNAVGSDYLVAQNAVFYRGSDTRWSVVKTSGGAVLTFPGFSDGGFDSASIINAAPSFLATVTVGGSAVQNSVGILPLRNGGAPTSLASSLPSTTYGYNTPNSTSAPLASGQGLSGASTLITWPAAAALLSQAQSVTLFQYAGQGMSGPIPAYPVSSLTIDDGFGRTYDTAYEFDTATATCDPTGQAVKFLRSAAYDGCADPSQSALGRTVYIYRNGYVTAATAAILDGLPVQTLRFSGAAAFTCNYDPSYELDPAGAVNGAATAVPAALANVFLQQIKIELSSTATLQYLQPDVNLLSTGITTYAYWQILDPSAGTAYNIDFLGDPQAPTAGGRLRVFTGQVLETSTTAWTVFGARNVGTAAPDVSPLVLHGGFARPTGIARTQDGVPLLTQCGYVGAGFTAPSSPLLQSRTWTLTDAAGVVTTHVEAHTPVAAVQPLAAGLNLLQPVATSVHRVTPAGSDTVTVSATASVWQGWKQQGGAQLTIPCNLQQWTWIGDPSGADVGVFPFDSLANPALWVDEHRVTAVRDDGLVVEWQDALGTAHAVLWDERGQVSLAQVTNASFEQGQVAFTSFDPGENLSAWSFAGGASNLTQGGRASAAALTLPPGGSATRVALAPDIRRILLMTVWVKVPAGYQAQTGSGWTLTLRAGTSVIGTPVSQPFPESGGLWQRQSVVLDLPKVAAGATKVTLTIAATNAASASAAVAIDDLIVVPLGADFSALNCDPVWRLSLAKLSAVGDASPIARDAFQRRVAQTDAAGSLTSLSLSYLSLTGNPLGFAAADPNAQLTLRALRAGSVQQFLDDSWSTMWAPSAANVLGASNGVLAQSGASSVTLTAVPALGAGTMALYVELVSLNGAPLTLTDTLTIEMGEGAVVLSQQGSALVACHFTVAGTAVGTPTTLPAPLQTVLLAQVQGRVLLWVNGQRQVSWVGQLAGAPTLSTGRNAVGLRNLALLDGVSMDIVYSDATGASRQRQAVTAEDYTLQQTIRDAAGQAIVTTKRAPGLFGSGASVAVPAYRPGFVDVDAFLAGLDQQATMTGDVAHWYAAGQASASNDQGFPYFRTIREPAPEGRTAELGFPGPTLSVRNVASTAPAARNTYQHRYGNEVTLGVPACLDLPSGSALVANYRVARTLDPSKAITATVDDAAGGSVGRYGVIGATTSANLVLAEYTAGVVTTEMRQPDYYALGATTLATTEQRNALAQVVASTSPDIGATLHRYDRGGRMRLIQDALAAAQGQAIYLTWDALARQLSRGVITLQSLDAVTASELDDPLWPENQQTYATTVQRRWAWDGDGSDLCAVGRLASTSTSTGWGAASAAVTYDYTHDANGRTVRRDITVAPSVGAPLSASVAYAYDNQNRLATITYPAAVGAGFCVNYTYDGQDRITAITDGTGFTFATYTRDAQGNAIAETRGPAGIAITRSVDSLDRIVSHTVGAPGDVTYRSTTGWAADGMLTGRSEQLMPTIAGFSAAMTFDYDPLWRLTSAAGEASNAVTLGFTTDDVVEHNGNIRTITEGGAVASIAYQPGTNRIATVTPAAGAATSYTFLANGALASARTEDATLAFTYVPGTLQPATATPPTGAVIRFALDSSGHRILRQAVGSQPRVIILDEAGGALATLAPDGTATAWVHGPEGLVGMLAGGLRSSIVTDALHTPRLVFDATGVRIAAYAYDTLGRRVAAVEPTAGFLPWGFTGQLWDNDLALYDFGTRFYDLATGRFVTPDPMGQFPSPYCYVANQPTMRIDPTGMSIDWGKGVLEVLLIAGGFAASYVSGGLAMGIVEDAGTALWSVVGNSANAALSNAAAYTRSSAHWTLGGFGLALATGAGAGAVGGVFGAYANNALKAEASLTAAQARDQAMANIGRGVELPAMNQPAAPMLNQGAAAVPLDRNLPGIILKATTLGVVKGVAQSYVQNGLNNVVAGRAWNTGAGSPVLMSALLSGASGVLGGWASYQTDAYMVVNRLKTALVNGISPAALGGMIKAGGVYLGAAAVLTGGMGLYISYHTQSHDSSS